MAVTYAGTNNYGPFKPNVGTAVAGLGFSTATPDPPGGIVVSESPSNIASTNTGRTQTATQVFNVTDQRYGGTPPAKTKHTLYGGDVW